MKKLIILLSIFLLNISINCFAFTGAKQLYSGYDCITETEPEASLIPRPIDDLALEHLHPSSGKSSSKSGTITWSHEDWDGSYGAIAECLAIPNDGSKIYVAWNLNSERISAFEAAGTGTPIWEYDVREGSTYNINGSVLVRISDDGNVLVASVSGRNPVSTTIYESVLYRLDPVTGTDYWTPIIMPPTVEDPDSTETITHLDVAADGSIIVVGTRGYRSDPVYEPFFIHIYSFSGALIHTFEEPDPAGDIFYINDLKVTDNGSRIVADFRGGSGPKHLVKVYDLNSLRKIQEFDFSDEGPQCSIGLSGDGEILAIGNLRGVLRVFSYNAILTQYEPLWTYSIPPAYYYAWVTAIEISKDGSILGMGSYQPDSSANHGYLYVFNAVSGPPYIHRSQDLGDMMEDVAISDNGYLVAAAGWGPYSPPARQYDMVAYNTYTDEDVFLMTDTYPGSLFACEVDGLGKRLCAGGKRVHARAFGSGGWAYSISLDFVTPTPTGPDIPVGSPAGFLIPALMLSALITIASINRK